LSVKTFTTQERIRAIINDPVTILFLHKARISILVLLLASANLAFNSDRLLKGRAIVTVPQGEAFFSSLSQVIAALAGLLIAFFFFAMQDVVRRRDDAFQVFKSEMNRFLQLATERPPELSPFDQAINRVVYSFSLITLEDCEFPKNPTMSGISWDEASKGMTETFDAEADKLERRGKWYLQQMMAALLHAEVGLSSVNLYWVGMVVMKRIALDIREILALLALTFFTYWNLVSSVSLNFPWDALTPLSFTATIWLIVILVSLALNVRILYRDLSLPWSIDY